MEAKLCATVLFSAVLLVLLASTVQGRECIDKLGNCAGYGKSACKPPTMGWALKNCRKTCELCDYKTGSGNCQDIKLDCADWMANDSNFCSGSMKAFANTNCHYSCNFC